MQIRAVISRSQRLGCWALAICLLTTALSEVTSFGETNRSTNATNRKDAASNPKANRRRQREGDTVQDVQGTFKLMGERYWFTPTGGAPMCVLENLALERVAALVKEWGSDRTWQVSGTVTEYQEENLLLLSHAVMRAKGTGDLPSP